MNSIERVVLSPGLSAIEPMAGGGRSTTFRDFDVGVLGETQRLITRHL